MSLLEQYIQATQQSFERDIASARTAEERKAFRLMLKVSLWEVDAARKYRFTSSALAMIARLMPNHPSSGRIERLPGTGLWIVLDNPSQSNLYFSSIPLAISSYAETHHVTLDASAARIAARPWQWTLDISQIDKHPLSYLYDSNREQWTLNVMDLCPTKRCEYTGKDSTDWPGWYICDECRTAFDYWTTWFPIALMAINGDFAETEEIQEPQKFTTRELRKVPRPGGSGYEQKSITHTWHTITFDISVKQQPAHAPQEEAHEPLHPTWLERAIENETVVYVSKHIGQTQRTFRHERYVNMRGKTIDVRPYDKRIPMSVKHLKQTIYRTIAQKETS